MAAKKEASEPLKLGDYVKIKYFPKLQARIVELRGPLGPGGAQVYGIRIRNSTKPYYSEVLADQLEVVPPLES